MKKYLRLDIRDVFIGLFAIVAFVLFASAFTYIYFAKDLQTKEGVMNRNDTGVVLVDRNDKPFFTFYQGKYKSFTSISEVPKVTQEAVVVEEDRDFYSHPGFSIRSMVGALLADLKRQDLSYGGSTITQQLVKNALLSPHKSFLRKYQELILAQELERRYSKDEILEMYLNSVYLGNGAFGIDEAAQTYFGKKAKDLDVAQSALIAGLLPAPTELSPVTGDINRARSREAFVLQKMYEQRYITLAQYSAAQNEVLTFKGDSIVPFKAPHFALMVRQALIDKYGEEKVARSGFKVKTTLDLDFQTYAEEQVKLGVDRLRGNIVSNGAAVALDPKTGEVLALVGSKDWSDEKYGKFNIADAPRQPGSSFKPIVYSAALERRIITPATILQDSPTNFDNCPGAPPEVKKDPRCSYKPLDFDRKSRGPVTVRRALANSLNIPAVSVMTKVGVSDALDQAHRLGITTLNGQSTDYGLSLVLGAGEVKLLDLVDVYATLANQGKKNKPSLILEIDDKVGNTIYNYEPTPEEVLDPGVAYILSSILSDNATRAEEFGNALNISRLAAVKTGTTENFKDAWTMGYTPQVVVGVWVGNNDGTPMDQIAGSLGAAPIWKALMEKYLAGKPVLAFEKPDDVVASVACVKLAKEASSSANIKEYFLIGTESIQRCPSPAPSGSPTPAGASPTPIPSVEGVTIQVINQSTTTTQAQGNGNPPPGQEKKEH